MARVRKNLGNFFTILIDPGFLFVFSYTVCSQVPIDFPSGGYSGVDVDR